MAAHAKKVDVQLMCLALVLCINQANSLLHLDFFATELVKSNVANVQRNHVLVLIIGSMHGNNTI